MKLSLALIVAPTDEEAKKLNNCLVSAAKHVDEICITVTGKNKEVENVAKRYNAKVSHFEWEDDFAKARNFNFSQCTGDWILWLDADDILVGGEHLKKNITLSESIRVNGLQIYYEYGHADNGAVTDGHWKTQLVKNDGSAEWVGAIHEDLIQKRECLWAQIGKDEVLRVHTSTKAENNSHFERNLRILERERERNPDEPRTYIYLGRTYMGLGRFDEAIEALQRFIVMSGWDEERYEAHCLLGEIHEKAGMYREAHLEYALAMTEDPKCPKALVLTARVYLQEEKYEQVLAVLQQAFGIKKPNKGIMHFEMLMERDVYMIASVAYLHLGKYEEAYQNALRAAKHDPANRDVDALIELTKQMRDDESMTRTFLALLKWYEKNEPTKVRSLYELVPDAIRDDPRLSYAEPKVWESDEIAVFCGATPDSWKPATQNTGIGGSETAVIELTKRLVKKGWRVTVYNQSDVPPSGEVIDGVLYKNFWQLNPKDTFNILWIWRLPTMLSLPLDAKKKILDMHDTSNPEEFTQERIDAVDKIFVKTKYHRSLYPNVPDEKFVIVGNGIDLSRFDYEVERNPHKIIYSSSPNRGLENLLAIWPDVVKEVPDAELHTFYGWETYLKLQKDNPASMEWAEKMIRLMQQPGVINHGRVGQQELAKEMLSSSLWVYMTEFPEIHCITALEMQAAGVFPITTGFAALKEVQKSGTVIPGDPKTEEVRDQFKEEVITMLTRPIVRDGMKDAVRGCSWDDVANVWNHELR